jgi:hypothetical protein
MGGKSAIGGGSSPATSDVIHLENLKRGAFQHLAHFTKLAVLVSAHRFGQ